MNKKEGNQNPQVVEAIDRDEKQRIAIEQNRERIAIAKKNGEKFPSRFVKGQVVNPNGKPKGLKDFRTFLNNVLDTKVPEWSDEKKRIVNVTKRSMLANKIIDNALNEEKPDWTKVVIAATERKEKEESSKPIINVNIANFKEMSIEDLLNAAGNPNDNSQ